jgi:hypothetical protein
MPEPQLCGTPAPDCSVFRLACHTLHSDVLPAYRGALVEKISRSKVCLKLRIMNYLLADE